MTEQHPGSLPDQDPEAARAVPGTPLPGGAAEDPPAAEDTPAAEDAPAAVAAGQPDGPQRNSEGFRVKGLVDEPAKVMRIGGMVKQLLEEVKAAPLDESARGRLADIHERSVHELEQGLSDELRDELHRLRLPFSEGQTPSESELRIAQAQLVGWLEGVFHGIQTALAAQQLANQQLAQRIQLKELPPGTQVAPGVVINDQGEPVRSPSASEAPDHGPGQYL